MVYYDNLTGKLQLSTTNSLKKSSSRLLTWVNIFLIARINPWVYIPSLMFDKILHDRCELLFNYVTVSNTVSQPNN